MLSCFACVSPAWQKPQSAEGTPRQSETARVETVVRPFLRTYVPATSGMNHGVKEADSSSVAVEPVGTVSVQPPVAVSTAPVLANTGTFVGTEAAAPASWPAETSDRTTENVADCVYVPSFTVSLRL